MTHRRLPSMLRSLALTLAAALAITAGDAGAEDPWAAYGPDDISCEATGDDLDRVRRDFWQVADWGVVPSRRRSASRRPTWGLTAGLAAPTRAHSPAVSRATRICITSSRSVGTL